MSDTPQILCDDLRTKCHTRDVILKPLYEHRALSPPCLGSLGPARFTDVHEFLRQQPLTQRVTFNSKKRPIVAFGDIHSDFLVLLTLLRMVGVIDDRAHWVGANTLVIFCGDLLDRHGRGFDNTGINPREELDIIQYLEALDYEANSHQGGVVCVVGNHELGRVFSQAGFRTYTGTLQLASWGGEDNMKRVFSPGGRMACYMAKRFPVMVRVANYVFMHGGPPRTSTRTLGQLNDIYRACLVMPGSTIDPEIHTIVWDTFFSSTGPGSVDRATCSVDIDSILRRLGVRNPRRGGLVIGHRAHKRLESFCGGKVWRLDLAMSEGFGKNRPIGGVVITERGCIVQTIEQLPRSDTLVVTTHDRRISTPPVVHHQPHIQQLHTHV